MQLIPSCALASEVCRDGFHCALHTFLQKLRFALQSFFSIRHNSGVAKWTPCGFQFAENIISVLLYSGFFQSASRARCDTFSHRIVMVSSVETYFWIYKTINLAPKTQYYFLNESSKMIWRDLGLSFWFLRLIHASCKTNWYSPWPLPNNFL